MKEKKIDSVDRCFVKFNLLDREENIHGQKTSIDTNIRFNTETVKMYISSLDDVQEEKLVVIHHYDAEDFSNSRFDGVAFNLLNSLFRFTIWCIMLMYQVFNVFLIAATQM